MGVAAVLHHIGESHEHYRRNWRHEGKGRERERGERGKGERERERERERGERGREMGGGERRGVAEHQLHSKNVEDFIHSTCTNLIV